LRPDLDERERRALAFLDLLANDHWAIDDGSYADSPRWYTAEIVGRPTCSNMSACTGSCHPRSTRR
jgi:hypothetical protein